MVLSSGKGMKMKVQKYEIARVIDKLKSIVQKNDQFPALGGILVKDGYLIASNSEITMKVKLEASEGSYFIIPMKAFDCDNIALGFTSPRTPMIVEAEDSDMKAMVLPVAIREA